MKVCLKQSEIQQLHDKNKVYAYLQKTFTKTYLQVGGGSIILFFNGVKGAIKTSVQIEDKEESIQTYLIDYDKWLNALSKLSFAENIFLETSAKSLSLSMEGSTDKIALGITTFSQESPEALLVSSFIEDTKNSKKINKALSLNQKILEAMQIANTMFSSVCKNNTIAINSDSVLYADRSIILKILLDQSLDVSKDIYLHKYTIGLIALVSRYSNNFFFDEDFGCAYWEDDNTQCVLASEPCEISFPSEEDISNLTPTKYTFEVSQSKILSGLDFFNGFYASSSWKPITFEECLEGLKLHYQHPTAEVSKIIDLNEKSGTLGVSFSIMSEVLENLLEQSSERIPDVPVSFTYDEDSAGVLCTVGNMYRIIFAKITV